MLADDFAALPSGTSGWSERLRTLRPGPILTRRGVLGGIVVDCLELGRDGCEWPRSAAAEDGVGVRAERDAGVIGRDAPRLDSRERGRVVRGLLGSPLAGTVDPLVVPPFEARDNGRDADREDVAERSRFEGDTMRPPPRTEALRAIRLPLATDEVDDDERGRVDVDSIECRGRGMDEVVIRLSRRLLSWTRRLCIRLAMSFMSLMTASPRLSRTSFGVSDFRARYDRLRVLLDRARGMLVARGGWRLDRALREGWRLSGEIASGDVREAAGSPLGSAVPACDSPFDPLRLPSRAE